MVIEERRIEKRSFFKRADGLCGLCTQWKWLSWSIPSVISSFKSETIQIYLEMHLGSTLGLEKAFHFPRFVCVRFLIDQIGNPFKYSPQHVQAVFFFFFYLFFFYYFYAKASSCISFTYAPATRIVFVHIICSKSFESVIQSGASLSYNDSPVTFTDVSPFPIWMCHRYK